jgi:hypothetical protein
MDKNLKTALRVTAISQHEKWLFGSDADMPKDIISIYQGLPEAFIQWFEKEILGNHSWCTYYSDKITYMSNLISSFNGTLNWIYKFQTLIHQPLVKPHIVQCAVETKQEYKWLSHEDITDVIHSWGLAANHLFTAQRDHFHSKPLFNGGKNDPLNIYYQLSLEYLMWHFASFVQEGNFTDLHTRLKEIISSKIKGDIECTHA